MSLCRRQLAALAGVLLPLEAETFAAGEDVVLAAGVALELSEPDVLEPSALEPAARLAELEPERESVR